MQGISLDVPCQPLTVKCLAAHSFLSSVYGRSLDTTARQHASPHRMSAMIKLKYTFVNERVTRHRYEPNAHGSRISLTTSTMALTCKRYTHVIKTTNLLEGIQEDLH